MHYGSNQEKSGQKRRKKILSTNVKLSLFNSQIVKHYITGSVFTNFAYMRSLDALKVCQMSVLQNLPRITEEKYSIFLLKC